MRTTIGAVLLMGLSSAPAFAQDAEYQVPKGEQPEYGKDYARDERDIKKAFVEINLLRFAREGAEIHAEMRVQDHLSLGADLVYAQFDEENGGVKLKANHWAVAPSVRYYAQNTLTGAFAGGKLEVGQVSWTVKSGGRELGDESSTAMAAMAHVGYRFLFGDTITSALYAGAGAYVVKPDFEDGVPQGFASNVAWQSVLDDTEERFNGMRFDFGLTIGVAF